MGWIFLSNYYTHHQKALCEELYSANDGDFAFLANEEFSEERKNLGWSEDNDVGFVRQVKDIGHKATAEALDEADVVIFGAAPLEMVTPRLKKEKIVLKYSERVYKNGLEPLKWFPRLFRFRKRYGKYKSLYLLAASAYTTFDYAVHGTFIGKSYKWGYFPENKHYNVDELMSEKDCTKILWCGRFLDWKHPEAAVEVARRLKSEGYSFSLEFIGTGDMEKRIKETVKACSLDDCVHFFGATDPEDVRHHMESAGIYLFTSDFHEGWGAVLNESMNSGCAVVASHAIGAVPFLIEDNENGIVYKNGDVDDLYRKVKYLLDNPEKQKILGVNAYNTIDKTWNANVAAKRLTKLVSEIKDHGYCDLYESGPCSRAPVIKNNWYKG